MLATTMQKVAALLAAQHPDDLTIVFRVALRGERVFVIDDLERLLERPDSLAQRALAPSEAEPFVAAVDAAFQRSGLVLETFDRFRS